MVVDSTQARTTPSRSSRTRACRAAAPRTVRDRDSNVASADRPFSSADRTCANLAWADKNVTKHPKWAIPWMEDDPDLTASQLWVNRTLMHMEDAKSAAPLNF